MGFSGVWILDGGRRAVDERMLEHGGLLTAQTPFTQNGKGWGDTSPRQGLLSTSSLRETEAPEMVGPVSWDSLSGMDSPGGSGVCSQPGSYEAAVDLVCLARVLSCFLPLAFYPLWLPFSSLRTSGSGHLCP